MIVSEYGLPPFPYVNLQNFFGWFHKQNLNFHLQYKCVLMLCATLGTQGFTSPAKIICSAPHEPLFDLVCWKEEERKLFSNALRCNFSHSDHGYSDCKTLQHSSVGKSTIAPACTLSSTQVPLSVMPVFKSVSSLPTKL